MFAKHGMFNCKAVYYNCWTIKRLVEAQLFLRGWPQIMSMMHLEISFFYIQSSSIIIQAQLSLDSNNLYDCYNNIKINLLIKPGELELYIYMHFWCTSIDLNHSNEASAHAYYTASPSSSNTSNVLKKKKTIPKLIYNCLLKKFQDTRVW